MLARFDDMRPLKVLIGTEVSLARLAADTEDLLRGIDADVATLRLASTVAQFPTSLGDHQLVVAAPIRVTCSGHAALANLGLALAFHPQRVRPINVVSLFTREFDSAHANASGAVTAIGDLGASGVGLVTWEGTGVAHVSQDLVEAIGYPDPSLPDAAYLLDYALRALGVGFQPVFPSTRPSDAIVGCLDAKYHGFAAALERGPSEVAQFGKTLGRQFVGPIAGLVDLEELWQALTTWRAVPEPMSAAMFTLTMRVAAYIGQAARLTDLL